MKIHIDINTFMSFAVKPKKLCTNAGTAEICRLREPDGTAYIHRSVGIFRKTETGFRNIMHIPLNKRRYYCTPCADAYFFNNH